MHPLTQQDLQAIAHAAMSLHKPTADQASALLRMAREKSARTPANDTLIDLIEAADFDIDVNGRLGDGLALQLAETLLDEESSDEP